MFLSSSYQVILSNKFMLCFSVVYADSCIVIVDFENVLLADCNIHNVSWFQKEI